MRLTMGKIGKFDAIEEHSFIKNFDDVLDDLDSEYFFFD